MATKSNEYDLRFFNENNDQVGSKTKVVRNNKNENFVNYSSLVYVMEREFDYMEVSNGKAQGVIIPKFQTSSTGNEDFHFAVDFGTTNTHIEYKKGRTGAPKPFSITEQDLQAGTLHDPHIDDRYDYLKDVRAVEILEVPTDLFPEKLEENHDFNFPQRTALAESKGVDFSKPTYSMADFNIPFIYENRSISSDTNIETGLKWSNYTMDEKAKRRVEAFFEKLLFIIRAKVLLNNGDLARTKMIWFYPSSMMEGRVNRLEAIWKDLYKKYISEQEEPQKLSESIAPYYYYKQAHNVLGQDKPIVSVDIGGGTTDVVIYKQEKPIVLTSFKNAANTIFGDGFSEYGRINSNGFIKKYESKIVELLSANMLPDLLRVNADIKEAQKSIDVIAFYFSLEKNKKIRERDLPISFSKMLKDDDDLRILFVVFFAAIIYHIGQLMKAKGLAMPRHITFSGNGSKILQYITDSVSTLESFSKLILEKIYGTTYDSNGLSIHKEMIRPKEATCKGGLMMGDDFSFDAVEKIKTTLVGTKNHMMVNGSMTGEVENAETTAAESVDTSTVESADVATTEPADAGTTEPADTAATTNTQTEQATTTETSLRYDDVNEEMLQSVASEFRSFVDFLFNLNRQFSFTDKLSVSSRSIELAKTELVRDLMENIKTGMEIKKREMTDKDKPVEETFFFYPLTGSLNRLAYSIAAESDNS